MKRQRQRALRNVNAGIKSKAIPGGVGKKLRNRLKSVSLKKKAPIEKIESNYDKRLAHDERKVLGRLEVVLNSLHINNPPERASIRQACMDRYRRVKQRKQADTIMGFMRQRTGERIQEALKKKEHDSKERMTVLFNQDNRARDVEDIIEREMERLISEPPSAFKKVFGNSAQTYWKHVRTVLFSPE